MCVWRDVETPAYHYMCVCMCVCVARRKNTSIPVVTEWKWAPRAKLLLFSDYYFTHITTLLIYDCFTHITTLTVPLLYSYYYYLTHTTALLILLPYSYYYTGIPVVADGNGHHVQI